MQQMTKEELIEYFIELLGDNEILGKVMSIEQIREKLNNTIKKVTYDSEKNINGAGACGSWNSSSKTLNLDFERIGEKKALVIVHELLHVLTDSEVNNNNSRFNKSGFSLIITGSIDFNRAINEGMTDALAEQITGLRNDGYNEEKRLYGILSDIIGQKEMLKQYCCDIDETYGSSINDFEEKARNIFREDIIKKYGLELGEWINNNVKRVLFLSDKLCNLDFEERNYGLNSSKKRLYREIKQEIDDTLLNIFERVINNEHDIIKKVDMLSNVNSYFSGDKYKEVFNNVIFNNINLDNLGYTERIELFQRIKQKGLGAYIPKKIVVETLFGLPEADTIDAESKLKQYFDLKGPDFYDIEDCNRVYELYASSGKIEEKFFDKRKIFNENILLGCYGMESINLRLTEIKYQKVGDYYRTCGEYISEIGTFYDKNGDKVEPINLQFNALNDENVTAEMDIVSLSKIIPEGKIKLIEEQLKDKFKQYQIEFQEENIEYCSRIECVGNMLSLGYCPKDKNGKEHREFYSIDTNGELQQIEIRRRKKNVRRYV